MIPRRGWVAGDASGAFYSVRDFWTRDGVTVIIPWCGYGDKKRFLGGWRAQEYNEPLIIHIIDSGSLPENRWSVPAMDFNDPAGNDAVIINSRLAVESVYWASDAVAMALDAGFSMAQTKYVVCSHSDVYLTDPLALSTLISKMDDGEWDIVGPRMSPRYFIQEPNPYPAHTFTAYRMTAVWRRGLTWGFRRDALDFNGSNIDPVCYDTEVSFGFQAIRAGLKILITGEEPNEPYETPWYFHDRSASCHGIYANQSERNLKLIDVCPRWKRGNV
jgi:hypothetical protein